MFEFALPLGTATNLMTIFWSTCLSINNLYLNLSCYYGPLALDPRWVLRAKEGNVKQNLELIVDTIYTWETSD